MQIQSESINQKEIEKQKVGIAIGTRVIKNVHVDLQTCYEDIELPNSQGKKGNMVNYTIQCS